MEKPLPLFNLLDQEFNFTLDAAASAENALCAKYYHAGDSAFVNDWPGNVFCNPPYGHVIRHWLKKGWQEAQENANVVVFLIPAKTDTLYWWNYCRKGEVRFIKGRITFRPPHFLEGKVYPAGFPSAVIIFRQHNYPTTKYWDYHKEAQEMTFND